MGNHHSVPKTISYDEAVVRIGKDLERIEERFHYLASSLNFSKIDFENLFSDNMDFGHLLFYAFCRCPETNYFKNFEEGISFEEFIRKFAMVYKGSEEERVGFCYLVFDSDGDCKLTKDEFSESLFIICNAAWNFKLPIMYSFTSQHPLPPKKKDYDKIIHNIIEKFVHSLPSSRIHFDDFRLFLSTYPQIRMFVEYALVSMFVGTLEMQRELKHFQAVSRPLFIGGDSTILQNEDDILLLRCWLPEPFCSYNWYKIYSSSSNGFSLGSLFNLFASKPKEVTTNSSILIIKDEHDYVFGVYSPDAYRRNSDRFYGSEETFLFSLYPKRNTFRCTGENVNLIYSNNSTLSFGGSYQNYALSLDSEFYRGSSQPSSTYLNPQLSFSQNFSCRAVELWSFVDIENSNKLLGICEEDDEENDSFYSAFKKKKNGKTAVERYKDKVYVLDLIDKHYTANLEPPPKYDQDDVKPSKTVLASHGTLPTSYHKKNPYSVD